VKRFPQETFNFVENYVFNFLDSLRKSNDMEERYRPVSISVKTASTKKLRALSNNMTRRLLEKAKGIEEIGQDSELIRDVLNEVLQDSD
jgi:hypothetical protein